MRNGQSKPLLLDLELRVCEGSEHMLLSLSLCLFAHAAVLTSNQRASQLQLLLHAIATRLHEVEVGNVLLSARVAPSPVQ